MNKLFFTGILLLLLQQSAAQVTFNSWSNNYLQLNSYNGNVAANAFTFDFSGNGMIDVPRWQLSVRLKKPITASNGAYTFPADKISFQPVSTAGQAVPGPVPTVSQIAMPLNITLLEGSELFLVPRSNAALYNNPQQPNGYYDLNLNYNLTVAGGAYLGNFPSWTNFSMVLEFRFYDQHNKLLGIREHTYTLQLGELSGTPPVTAEFSLQVAAGAANGVLELKDMADYANGATAVYNNGLRIKANTSYQILVKALGSGFVSGSGNMLPLSVVHLALTPVSGNNGASFPIALSTAPQKVAAGTATNGLPVYFDLRYSTKPNDPLLVQAKMDEYAATLQYEIIPQ
ncbi:hypothetical protein LQ567_24765 [Niabella pedocola]|uniref:Uncharacterized protein n=1 Tax=Niabella pedocola TaxID=1752077 RepID=A0ABS8PY98_9BACT|nr:hypothetical protein [Niabella pedocola]MCD2426020.1 hypothetical protein [Niabella pedocola]